MADFFIWPASIMKLNIQEANVLFFFGRAIMDLFYC